MVTHQPTPGQEAARAVLAGMDRAQTPPPDAEALEDERLTGDANEAGYRWAERRALTNAAKCPNFAREFRAGCEEYAREAFAGGAIHAVNTGAG